MTVLLGAAVFVATVDALTKYLVTVHLVEGRLYGVGGGWGLRRVHNQRGALAGLSVTSSVVLWIAMACCVGFALRLAPAGIAPAMGLGAALGGAAGNLVDQIVRGVVVDFVAAGPWPVFNVADAAMVGGLLLAAGSLL
jgi:signal peptidase II